MLVDEGGEQLGEGEDGVGDRAAGHAAVHRTVEGAHPHVDPGQAAQRVGEAGDADRPVAGVGEEQHVGAQVVGVGVEEPGEAGRADLLLALDQHLHVARRARRRCAATLAPRRRARPRRPCRRRCRGRRAGRRARPVRTARTTTARRSPPVARRGARTGARSARRGVASTRRRRTGSPPSTRELAHVVQAGVAQEVADRAGAVVDVADGGGIGADARDAHEGLEVVTRGVGVGARRVDRGLACGAGVHAAEARSRS